MNDNDKTFHNSILGPVETSIPRDYVTPEERMKQALRSGPLPRAERREPDASVLICITMFGIFGMIVGFCIALLWLL